MPAFNEEEGIVEFLSELNESLSQFDPFFVVVDDLSTDGTSSAVQHASTAGINCTITTNPSNLGHGPSTLSALRLGLRSDSDYIIALDGDGQFIGADVAKIVKTIQGGDYDIVEGVRLQRGDPIYRRFVSSVTRTLVRSRAGERPTDANTPLRAYKPEILLEILEAIPADASTPNLLISAITRRRGLNFTEVGVTSIPRRGSDSSGSTWKAKTQVLPSKRFIKFCAKATRQWLTTPLS